jgi:hypothetical protein
MDAVIETLNSKLQEWQPDIAAQVRQRILEIMELADHNSLDVLRSRQVEQEVLNLLDEDETW